MPMPADKSLDDVKVRIRQAYSNPSVGKISQVVLKDGPRAFKIASLLEIIDPNTREFHHYSLKLDHIDKKKSGWFAKPERSLRLDGKEPDEIDRLYRFLHAANRGSLAFEDRDLHIIRSDDYAKLEALLEGVPNLASADKIRLVATLIDQIAATPSLAEELVSAFENTSEDTLRHVASAARFVDYRGACHRLKDLIEDPDTREQSFQDHLTSNPWMFGSEYSELLPRRTWTRDDKLDYMLRRTVDGYLEIVEIKTAFREPLFIQNPSRSSFYPSSKLSQVVGQVIRYVEEVERNRDHILAKDKFDTLKIRARAIVGRDGGEDQGKALRSFNGHLHGIEILTYDQLLRIAERVLSVFEAGRQSGSEEDTQPPF